MASATEKPRPKIVRRALSGIVTLGLAAAFSAIEWPLHLLRAFALPEVPAGNLPLAAAAAACILLLIAVATLAVLYARALGAGRQAEAARESAAGALRSHRAWLAEMEEKYTAASAASRFQSLFVAHVSNELRMPINAMLGFSEIIKDEMFGPIGAPRYKGYAQSLHQSAGQLLRSVNNLLDLSRITADRLELRERAIELPVVLAQITNGFATAAESRNLTLTLEVKENLPRLRADLRLLRSMMQALISNAVKFTGKRQKITVRALLDDGNRIVIAVADTGEGIAPKDLTDIMQPFGQAFSSDKPRRSGIGLGLPLTKSMVELHGGTFELRSVEHEGTTVTLRFPAERTVAEAKPAEEPAAAEAAPPPAAAEAETPPPARPQEPQELRRNII